MKKVKTSNTKKAKNDTGKVDERKMKHQYMSQALNAACGYYNEFISDFELSLLNGHEFEIGDTERALLLSPQLYGMCMAHKEIISIGIEYNLSDAVYYEAMINFIACKVLDKQKVESQYGYFDIGVPEQFKTSYPIDRMDVKSHVPSVLTTEYQSMNVAINLHGLSQATWDILEKAADNMQLASAFDVIRLGIFRIFGGTDYYRNRYHQDMDFMLDPFFERLWCYTVESYVAKAFKKDEPWKMEGNDDCELDICQKVCQREQQRELGCMGERTETRGR